MNDNIVIWLELALEDLKSSKILYEYKNHRTSFFLFQQATEKANKAFSILSNLFTENDLQKISHDLMKIHRKATVEQERMTRKMIEIVKHIPAIGHHPITQQFDSSKRQKELNASISFIDSLKSKDLINITNNDLNYLLEEIRGILKVRVAKKKFSSEFMKQKFLEIADWIGCLGTDEAIKNKKELTELINNEETYKEFENIIFEAMPRLIQTTFISVTLYYCSILVIQHSSLSRYPKDGINHKKLYNMRLPVVRKQVEFMELLEKAIKMIKKL